MQRPGADVAALRRRSIRRARDLRDRRAVRACLPGVDRYGAADEAAADVDAIGISAARGGVYGESLRSDAADVRAGLRRERPVLRRLAAGRVPALRSPLPAAAEALPETKAAGATALLFPSCVNRTIGALPGESNGRSVPDAMIAVAARAGQQLHIPRCVTRLCCGMPFGSKGYREAQEIAANATIGELWTASKEGALPIVVDTSPCAYAMTSGEGLSAENRERLARMRIVDAVAYFSTTVVPALTLRKRAGTVVLHPVCSLVKMGNVPALTALAAACSERVFVPPSSGCCGFAGDRGFFVPELTAAATRLPAAEVRAVTADGHYSSSRTCEIGMSRATGRQYQSWIHLLERATQS